MTESQEESWIPILLVAVAAFAAYKSLSFIHSPVKAQVQTPDQKAKIKEIKELRRLKEDFLKAEQASGVQDEKGVGSD